MTASQDSYKYRALSSFLKDQEDQLTNALWGTSATFAVGFARLTLKHLAEVFRSRQTAHITPDLAARSAAVLIEMFERADLPAQKDGIKPILGPLYRLTISPTTPEATRVQALRIMHVLARRYPDQAHRTNAYLIKARHTFENESTRTGEPIAPDLAALLRAYAEQAATDCALKPLRPEIR